MEITTQRKTKFDFETLQLDMLIWQQHNFPNSGKHIPLMGVCEELAELWNVNWCTQRIPSCAPEDPRAEMLDAVADTVIFLADYCNRYGLKLNEPVVKKREDKYTNNDLIGSIFCHVGMIMHHHIKLEQGIRGTPQQHMTGMLNSLARVQTAIDIFCANNDIELLDTVEAIWIEVKKRDWIKFPKNGLTE